MRLQKTSAYVTILTLVTNLQRDSTPRYFPSVAHTLDLAIRGTVAGMWLNLENLSCPMLAEPIALCECYIAFGPVNQS